MKSPIISSTPVLMSAQSKVVIPASRRASVSAMAALWLHYGAFPNRIINHKAALRLQEHAHHVEIIEALKRGDAAAADAAPRGFRVGSSYGCGRTTAAS